MARYAEGTVVAPRCAEPDPLVELVAALHAGRSPSLAWVVRWSNGGARDPVAGAWAASTDQCAMMRLLQRVGRWPGLAPVYYHADNRAPERTWPERTRAYAPVPPTLGELLRSAQRSNRY